MQGLDGGVSNAIATLGIRIGTAVAASIANNITSNARRRGGAGGTWKDEDALWAGYRAAFWFCIGTVFAALFMCVVGLRRIGYVGRGERQGEDGEEEVEEAEFPQHRMGSYDRDLFMFFAAEYE
jgi:hypothetical protein